jgi:hypothetical protein
MTFSRQEWNERLAAKAKQRAGDSLPAVRALQAAGVIMAKLTTSSDEWNRYLSYLQGQVDRVRAARADAQAKLNSPDIWEPSQMNKLKADILQADAMISAWEFAMQLPKALVDGGAEATEFLNKLDRENGETTGHAHS